MEPLVSVMMPARDCGRYIGKAIESILEQTHHNVELVIVDDGSKDDTYNIACTYSKNDSRIKLSRHARGLNAAMTRNDCLDQCKGEFVARQDADDWSDAERIERQVEWLAEHPDMDAVSCWMMRESENGKRQPRSSCNASVVARREVYDAVRFEEVLDCGEDGLWNLQARWSGFKGGLMTEPMYHYRFPRKGSLTATRKKYWRDCIRDITEDIWAMEKASPLLLRHLKACIPDIFEHNSVGFVPHTDEFAKLAASLRIAGYKVRDAGEPADIVFGSASKKWDTCTVAESASRRAERLAVLIHDSGRFDESEFPEWEHDVEGESRIAWKRL